MSSERDPFGLSGLAQPQSSEDGWPVVQAALKRRRSIRRYRWLASAAVVTLALGIFWQLPMQKSVPEVTAPGPALAETNSRQNSESNKDAQDAASLASLINLSQQLERNLRLIRSEVTAIPEQTLIYQVELQDLVAQLDEAINQDPESRELWSQRVNLLLDLNQIYRAQLRRDYSDVASL